MPRVGWSARLDDPPRVVVVAHVAAPGERLVGDPDAALGGALGQRAQLRGGERVVVDRVPARRSSRRASVSAPSALHHVELALGAAQVARAARPGTASKSRNGW